MEQQRLTAKEIRELEQAVCQEHLPLEADGYICTSAMLYVVLTRLRIASCDVAASRLLHAIRRFASFCWALRCSW